MSEVKIRQIIKKVLLWLGKNDGDVSISLVGDKKMRELNALYRGQNRVTDILSFSAREGYVSHVDKELGDIIICVPQVKRQARKNDIKITKEISLMLIHGLLHLLGFNHEKPGDARKMFRLQEKILCKL